MDELNSLLSFKTATKCILKYKVRVLAALKYLFIVTRQIQGPRLSASSRACMESPA